MTTSTHLSQTYNIYAKSNISIIVPFFNEEQIEKNIGLLESELKAYFQHYEIILVSDGSTNISPEKQLQLKTLSPHIQLHHYSVNQGKGYALKHGFSKSKGEYIAFIDGGMELHPKDIKRFLVLMDIYNADIVIGSKRHAYSKVEYPMLRKILSIIYQIFISITLNLKHIKDTQVGLKLFRRRVLEDTLPRVLVKKYAFDVELLTVANHLGYTNILEAPIELKFREEKQKGNVLGNLLHTLKVGWPLFLDTLAILYRLRILKYYDTLPSNSTNHRSLNNNRADNKRKQENTLTSHL